jgi:UDP-N-acetyl-D-galactosamine dehydrogenase
MGIDTQAVLEAAGTKWNFLPFRPGLVGGHCIGVDPYYLTHKAEKVGYIPQVILAGRRINDGMGAFVAQRTVKEMVRAGHAVKGARVTVLGLTFKEDCPDLRNSRVIDILQELESYDIDVQVADPIADSSEARAEYGVTLTLFRSLKPAQAVIAAVSHRPYRELTIADLKRLLVKSGVLIDVKSIYDPDKVRAAGIPLWRL